MRYLHSFLTSSASDLALLRTDIAVGFTPASGQQVLSYTYTTVSLAGQYGLALARAVDCLSLISAGTPRVRAFVFTIGSGHSLSHSL